LRSRFQAAFNKQLVVVVCALSLIAVSGGIAPRVCVGHGAWLTVPAALGSITDGQCTIFGASWIDARITRATTQDAAKRGL
jgi:hypothetical protein